MPNKQNCTFRKADIRRAVAAATMSGLTVAGIEYRPNGLIMIHTLVCDRALATKAKRVRYRSAAATEPVAVAAP